MSDPDPESFAALIRERLDQLEEEDARSAEARGTVALDQQSVGRLTRMDALQGQAMAKATHARRRQERARLEAALQRIADGGFGRCEECDEPIPQGRLRLDPAATRCVECAGA